MLWRKNLRAIIHHASPTIPFLHQCPLPSCQQSVLQEMQSVYFYSVQQGNLDHCQASNGLWSQNVPLQNRTQKNNTETRGWKLKTGNHKSNVRTSCSVKSHLASVHPILQLIWSVTSSWLVTFLLTILVKRTGAELVRLLAHLRHYCVLTQFFS